MNVPRGLEPLGARAGRGSCLEEQQGSARGPPQPPSARGRPTHPSQPSPSPLPHLRLCLLAPASRSWGSEDPWSPYLCPANSEKCETWGEGRGKQKLGASHPFRNLRSFPVLRGPAGTQTTPPPPPLSRGDFVCVPRPFASLFIPLSYQVSHPPSALRARVSLSRSPPLGPLPFLIPHPPSCLPSSHNLLCCFAWLCSYGDSGSPAAPKARPQRAGGQKRGQAATGGAAEGGQGQPPSVCRVVPRQVRVSGLQSDSQRGRAERSLPDPPLGSNRSLPAVLATAHRHQLGHDTCWSQLEPLKTLP